MASKTPDGASGEGPIHNYQALKKILRLAEEIFPLVEPGRKELEYMTEEREVSDASSREEQLQRLLEQTEDDLAEATNREAELNMQVTKLRKRLTDVENELNETKTRLSRTMGDKLTDNNPAKTDLSDTNRPVKLAERYSELYDNEWTDSFEIINKVYRDEHNTVAQLLKILMDVADFCRNESQKQFKKMINALVGENTRGLYYFLTYFGLTRRKDTPLPKLIEKQLRGCRKAMFEKAGYTLYEMYVAKLRLSTSSVARDALIVPAYLKETFTLCWQMCVQDPPVVFDEPPKHGDTFKSELYKSYKIEGTRVDFLVLPALLLNDGGPVLCRGVAQGFMYSLHEVPTSGQSLHRLPDRLERSQESNSGMINYQSTSANGRNPNANTASPLDINGLGGSLKTKPTQRVTSARDTDRLGSGRVSGVHKDQAPKLDLVMVPNDLNVQRPEEPAARSQTSTTSRQYENHNVDMLPNFRQNSAGKTDILDLTAKDINDFLSLINKLNYNYAAVQRVMDKSKFDACCKFIKTKYS